MQADYPARLEAMRFALQTMPGDRNRSANDLIERAGMFLAFLNADPTPAEQPATLSGKENPRQANDGVRSN